MVVVIEAMSSVTLARGHIGQVLQTACPQDMAAHCIPITIKLSLGEVSRSIAHYEHTQNRCARVLGVDLHVLIIRGFHGARK